MFKKGFIYAHFWFIKIKINKFKQPVEGFSSAGRPSTSCSPHIVNNYGGWIVGYKRYPLKKGCNIKLICSLDAQEENPTTK